MLAPGKLYYFGKRRASYLKMIIPVRTKEFS